MIFCYPITHMPQHLLSYYNRFRIKFSVLNSFNPRKWKILNFRRNLIIAAYRLSFKLICDFLETTHKNNQLVLFLVLISCLRRHDIYKNKLRVHGMYSDRSVVLISLNLGPNFSTTPAELCESSHQIIVPAYNITTPASVV